MKLLFIILLASISCRAQIVSDTSDLFLASHVSIREIPLMVEHDKGEIQLKPLKWRMDGNKWLTGSLIFVAGASKGFNETLMHHWKVFKRKVPGANPKWFNPAESWKNKYKNGDPKAGPRYPLSTTVLVMFTDQYHLNNFINKAAWTSALVVKIGEGKRPFKHYVMDFLFHSFCHQAGFALSYYPFN